MGSAEGWQVRFWVQLEPVPKGRPRFSRAGGGVRTRTDKRTRAFEEQLSLLSARYAPPAPLAGPVRLSLEFVLSPPKRLRARVLRGEAPEPAVKPDLDNLVKAVADALERSGRWFLKGDQQITHLLASKSYGEPAGVWVEVGGGDR